MTAVPYSAVPGRYAAPPPVAATVAGPNVAHQGGTLRTGPPNYAPAVRNSPRQPLVPEPLGFAPVQSSYALPAYGEPGHPIPEDFESTTDEDEKL